MKATFYVVDVPGPAVVGLPTSEQLHLVNIHVDSVTYADTHATKSTACFARGHTESRRAHRLVFQPRLQYEEGRLNSRMHRPTAAQRGATSMSSQDTHVGGNKPGTC